MNAIGFFEHNEAEVPKGPTRVVIKTDRGLELGHLVGQLGCYKGGQCRLSRSQVRDYYEDSEINLGAQPGGRFIRFATAEDISEERHLNQIAEEEKEFCKKVIKEMGLPMKLIEVDHIFGGERIIFYFMSDTRVDFRELVKRVAHEYQTRIEMRQIGSRDEAQLLGDYETCGQECCCRRFLKALKPVNMRMAKMQKATLDPSKISGYCGRLKCCLRYEDETYTELKRRLPRKNSRVRTPGGEGRVVDSQILTQLVVVEYDDGRRIAVGVEEIEVLDGGGRERGEDRERQGREAPRPAERGSRIDHVKDKQTDEEEDDYGLDEYESGEEPLEETVEAVEPQEVEAQEEYEEEAEEPIEPEKGDEQQEAVEQREAEARQNYEEESKEVEEEEEYEEDQHQEQEEQP
jgi:cell fate regulator YaaT (PSP1 superfamily)